MKRNRASKINDLHEFEKYADDFADWFDFYETLAKAKEYLARRMKNLKRLRGGKWVYIGPNSGKRVIASNSDEALVRVYRSCIDRESGKKPEIDDGKPLAVGPCKDILDDDGVITITYLPKRDTFLNDEFAQDAMMQKMLRPKNFKVGKLKQKTRKRANHAHV